ncbi:D-tagatose-bisphosphate aldolase, class II, non-catalytic subunit [Parashewanella tropica]|uniref:D-tagatose-bisphosphate aldolase, class II, non-catalytic subunit n=1 Tax=Parashewanella tropica TaxID=2547970 RepID=UPI001059CDE7|nr:D-tagatose-bisphosphate aldolase, class II, non-catalytic subunit [Parashewanella tropica]
MKDLRTIIKSNKNGEALGIYSICSAHPLVIESAIEQAKQDGTPLLIEATANQVNQFGGYTGMNPSEFLEFVFAIASKLDFPKEAIIAGGDHLGPVCWTNESAASAMAKSETLIESYVAAGFKKIHLDTSMGCVDEPELLDDEIVAQRAAHLCMVAEKTAMKHFGTSDIVYVVGTEVPPPGGASEELSTVDPTPIARVGKTIELHKQAFEQLSLSEAWERVIGLVVQPGVEFDHTGIVDYQPNEAVELKEFIKNVPNLAYEAHSSDYQNDEAYHKLIQDHFAILKVGPQLTFALREALFALSYIEDELLPVEQRSCLREVCDEEMQVNPKSWQKFYPVNNHSKFYRRFSYSDRIRYYWNNPRIISAVEKLLSNLNSNRIPLPLISQFFPEQYKQVRKNDLELAPVSLIKSKIKQVTEAYAQACWKQ